jgi:hypothetical protein
VGTKGSEHAGTAIVSGTSAEANSDARRPYGNRRGNQLTDSIGGGDLRVTFVRLDKM